MLRLPSAVSSLLPLVVASLLSASPAPAQSRVVDEGTFVFVKGGAPVRTENFRITRTEAAITATSAVTAGTQHITTLLATDTLGTPAQFELHVKDKGARVVDLKAMARSGRLTSLASSQTGDESMREYPLTPGKSVVLEPGLAHLLYFAVLGKSPGPVHVIEPRSTRTLNGTLSAKGLEPLEIAGKSVTGTHYTLAIGPTRYEFWVDAKGRLLRVDAGDGLTATRDDLPR
jgi:hypothetical protein